MLVNFLLLSSLLFLFCGLALDAGMLQLRRLQLQHAVDAAALGASYEKARGNTGWVAAGKADAALNGFTDGVAGVTISIVSPPTAGNYSGNTNATQARVSQSYNASFMGLVSGSGTVTPWTFSVAMSSYYPDCVYMMGPGTSYYTLDVDSNSGFFSGCNIYVNSKAYTILNNTNSTLLASAGNSIKVRGSSSVGNSLLGYTSPSPSFGSLSQTDPLAYESAPTFASCTTTGKVVTTTTTLNPGTYCGGITINAATVTFNPGLYIVTGGMTWENGSTVTGTGVTFYLTTGGGSTYANFNILNSTVTLSAPTTTGSGGMIGVVVFVDRNWSNQGNQGIQIQSSYVVTNGIWYALNTGIYNFVSTLKGTSYLGLVVDNIKSSAATFTIPTPDYATLTGGSPFQGSKYGSVVQ
jgi:Flp pilus assembly protein TadG